MAFYSIFPYHDKKAADKGTSLRIFNPENWEKNIQVDDKTSRCFKPTISGLYAHGKDWYDNTPDFLIGKAYGKTRYRNNYCLWIN